MSNSTINDCSGFDEVVHQIGGKWKLKILRKLVYDGTTRFNQLRRSIEGISQTMLTKQLKELEKDGYVKRKVYAEVPPKVEYTPTKKTQELSAMFQAMHSWALKNMP